MDMAWEKPLWQLTLIFLDAKRRALDPNAVFRPILIVVPSMRYHIWFDEITVRFGNAIKLHLFYGWQEILPDPVSTSNFLLGAEADKLDRLAKVIATLDSRSSHTAFTVFVTTYNTWQRSQGRIEDELLRRNNEVSFLFTYDLIWKQRSRGLVFYELCYYS